jgi:hypothetical protein
LEIVFTILHPHSFVYIHPFVTGRIAEFIQSHVVIEGKRFEKFLQIGFCRRVARDGYRFSFPYFDESPGSVDYYVKYHRNLPVLIIFWMICFKSFKKLLVLYRLL